ncbi:response regulator [Paraburkholderia terrae]|uniref:response regulator n=1 Tax=Paraburkholderia terrae TaxID=311230 RepID=UPI0030DEA09D
MKPQILIVDDDPVVRELFCSFLQLNGYNASVVRSSADLERRLERERPSLIVLDIMMPKTDNLRALTALRAAGDDIPVIIVTACDTIADRIIGLSLGADDYVAKPFDERELLARIQSVLRRCGSSTGRMPEARERNRFGPFELDLATDTLLCDDRRVALRDSDLALLKIFITSPYKVLSRVRIHDLVYRKNLPFGARSLDVPIWRLRRVIETDPSNPRYVQTVHGKGYVFVPDADADGPPFATDFA